MAGRTSVPSNHRGPGDDIRKHASPTNQCQKSNLSFAAPRTPAQNLPRQLEIWAAVSVWASVDRGRRCADLAFNRHVLPTHVQLRELIGARQLAESLAKPVRGMHRGVQELLAGAVNGTRVPMARDAML